MAPWVKHILLHQSTPSPSSNHPRLLCCSGSSSKNRIFPASIPAQPGSPLLHQNSSAASDFSGQEGDPCRKHHRNKFSASSPCPGGVLLLFLPWGGARWRQSSLQATSCRDLLRGAAGWVKKFTWGASASSSKTGICLTTAFSLSPLKYSWFVCFFFFRKTQEGMFS